VKNARLWISALALTITPLLSAQAPPSNQTKGQVLAILSVKNGLARDQIMKVMPDEIRATVRLYLDGKIQQWYSRGDGKGVVFILDCKEVSEARSLMEGLPLSKAQLVDFEYMPIGPLTPLRFLLSKSDP
jgi:hypothetical protein